MRWSEITAEMFSFIVDSHKCTKTENKELYKTHYYFVNGCQLLQIDNFLSCSSQYYIQDINA